MRCTASEFWPLRQHNTGLSGQEFSPTYLNRHGIEVPAHCFILIRSINMPCVRRDPDDASSVGGSEHWSDLQTKALCMAWYHVSAQPGGKGTSQTRDALFATVLLAYHYFYKKLGGVPPKPKKGVVPKDRTGEGCRTKWQSMNTCVTKFLACDILSSHTLRKSGATPANFREDALKCFIERHHHEFKFETAYDYLKDKTKWLNTRRTVRPPRRRRGRPP